MKRIEMLIVLFIIISSVLLFGQEKDVRDSFDYGTVLIDIGYVHDDTTTIADGFIYRWFNWTGANVIKIDTLWMDSTTYNGTNNWNSLDLVVIGNNVYPASVDTSLTNGIGDVPVIVLEPNLWKEFGFPDSTGTVSDDTLIYNKQGASYYTSMWNAGDTIDWAATNTAIAKFDSVFAGNVLAYSLDKADTLAALDTLDGVERIATDGILAKNELFNMGGWNEGEFLSYVIARFIAKISTSDQDSIFQFTAISIDELPKAVANLRSNGHTVDVVDTTEAKSATYEYVGNTVTWATDVEGVVIGNLTWAANAFGWLADRIELNSIPVLTGAQYMFENWSYVSNSGRVSSSELADSLRIETIIHTITENLILNDTLQISTSNNICNYVYTLDTDSVIGLGTIEDGNGDFGVNYSWVVVKNNRRAFLGHYSAGGSFTSNYFLSLDTTLYWLLSSLPQQASDVTLTALNTDSMEISWTDNSDNEDNFAVYVHNPDSAYYSYPAAGVEKDTIFYIWPPNSKVTADIAVIEGTDTLWSTTGKQTAYTDAAISESPRIWAKSNLELYYSLGGYGFEDTFIDSNYSSSPTWTVQAGTWGVIGPDYWIESRAVNDTLYSTYDHDLNTNMFRDSYISFDFQMQDTTYLSTQTARFYCMSDSADLAGTGYFVEIDSAALTFEKFNGASETVLVTYTWDRDFHWHTVLLKYDWAQLYYDGDSIGTSVDETYIPATGAYLGITASNAGIHFDNFLIYGITPGANHANTPFALNEQNSNDYVNFNTGVLGAATIWGYYSDFGSFSGGTLTGLTANTAYLFRFKAKSGWTK
jgi:hypothetical protein